ncbi:MAG TPA: hypothetical protein VI168_15935 [Croceibacterium sp.]
MTVRFAPLLAALALTASPAFAQDSAEEAPPPLEEPALAEAAPEDAPPPPEAAPEPLPADLEPLPAPVPAPAVPPVPPPSPFSPEQRTGWLMQCRNVFLQRGVSYGGLNGLPDACETQLLDYERTYVPAADGSAPVIPVRVPIVRPPAVPEPAPLDDLGE